MFEALKEMKADMEVGEWIDWLSKQMGFDTVEAMLADYMKCRTRAVRATGLEQAIKEALGPLGVAPPGHIMRKQAATILRSALADAPHMTCSCGTPMIELKIDGGRYCPACHRMEKVA